MSAPLSEDQGKGATMMRIAQSFACRMGVTFEIDESQASLYMGFIWNFCEPGPGLPARYVSGSQLIENWKTDRNHLLDELPAQIPIYLWKRDLSDVPAWDQLTEDDKLAIALRKGDSFERINDRLLLHTVPEICERYFGRARDAEPENIWFTIPQWWVFESEHVRFFEKLHPEICGPKVSDHVNDWLTSREVRIRLPKIRSNRELEDLVCGRKLKAFELSSRSGIEPVNEDTIERTKALTLPGLFGCLFKPEDVEEFASTHPSYKKVLRTSENPDKKAVRIYSDGKIRKKPTITQTELVEAVQQTPRIIWRRKKKYSDRQIEEWLRELYEWPRGRSTAHSGPKPRDQESSV